MTLLAFGINHKTAPIALRERVAFGPEKLNSALDSLQLQTGVQSGVILSTCNRTELYVWSDQTHNMRDHLTHWLCRFHQVASGDLVDSVYCYQDDEAVSHLMRVASGLDSLVLGEPQILGQVKQAFTCAQRDQQLAPVLKRLFQKSFSVAKRVRTETEIGSSAVSVAYAACMLARQIFESLSELTILLIGAGKTIELVARHLRDRKVKTLLIANRSQQRAQQLADQVGAHVIPLTEMSSYLAKADIVITSTASMLPIVKKEMIEHALKTRRNQPMLLVDIAVPRDIEPATGDLANVYLYTVDDLQAIIDHNLARRQAAAIEANHIVSEASAAFMAWLRVQKTVATIRAYRAQADEVRSNLEERALAALAQGVDPCHVMQELAHKLTNRLIHAPTQSLQQAARDGDAERLQILRDSLGLDELPLHKPG